MSALDSVRALLDQSPGVDEYVRGLANLAAMVDGADSDLYLAYLSHLNDRERQAEAGIKVPVVCMWGDVPHVAEPDSRMVNGCGWRTLHVWQPVRVQEWFVIADTSAHGLPIGAIVTLSRRPEWSEEDAWYTQGGDGDEVSIYAADLVPLS